MKNQKSVFEFGDEFLCTEFWDADLSVGGIEVNKNGVQHLGSIIGISIPDVEDEDECIKFDKEVVNWIVDNENL